MDSMRAPISRRRFLKSTAAGLSTIANAGNGGGAAGNAGAPEARHAR